MHCHWLQGSSPSPESEAEELFGARPVPKVPQATSRPSLLSQMLEQDDLAENPYLEYAKWDASVRFVEAGEEYFCEIWQVYETSETLATSEIEIAASKNISICEPLPILCSFGWEHLP